MKKILILLLFLFPHAIIAQEKKLEKVSLQLHWKYQFEFAGFIAAQEKGFYKDAGLNVELKEYNFGQNIIKDVSLGKSNYGIYNSNILVEYIKKEPIQLISSYFKRSALVLITKPDIKYPKDLIGKRIMAAGENDFNLNFNYIFSLQKIKINELNLIPHSFDVKDFAEDKVDAMTAFISDQPYKLDKLNIKYNLIDPSSYGIFNLQLELFTSNKEALDNRDRTEAFKQASLKGWEYALNNPEEIIEIILKKYNTQNLSKEFLENEAIYTERLILPKMYELGSIDEMFLFKQIDILYKEGNFDFEEKKQLINDFIFYSEKEIDKKNQEKNYELLKKTIPFLIILILIFLYSQFLLKRYNKKLKKEVEEKTTEFKKQNQELINSNQNFFDLLNTAIEAIAIFDENDNLIKLNTSGKVMFDYYFKKNSKKKKISDFIQKESLFEVKEKLENKIFDPFEINLLRNDKTIFPALIALKTIIKDNKTHTIITVIDLTQIKLQNEFIQQQAKLAQMGELLNMIAHQWRQPLTAISAASENLKLKAMLNKIDSSIIEVTTNDINKYTSYLSNTINDFRNFYKTDKSIEITTTNEMIEKSLNIIEDSICFKNISIIKNLNATTSIKTYLNEVTQVLLAFLQNAEEVLIEKQIVNPYIKINTFEDFNFIYLQIIDNGGGIPENIINKIFEPYFSTKYEKNGTGLGLYFAKNIIENNCNALLTAENNKDEAIFTIKFKKE
ncbi:ABC transporter substrate-binding protein [Arcobacter sp. s6]|uniref:ABC transporter substrate-binding protein n=1 Tax=Arcobacter sp. s6 TaxID=3230363 RepID=UPI0034A04454